MYSDQPTMPSSVVTLRNELTRQPASQCRSSILVIFMAVTPNWQRRHCEERGGEAISMRPVQPARDCIAPLAIDFRHHAPAGRPAQPSGPSRMPLISDAGQINRPIESTNRKANDPGSSSLRGQDAPPPAARRGRARRDDHHYPPWPAHRPDRTGDRTTSAGNHSGDRQHQEARVKDQRRNWDGYRREYYFINTRRSQILVPFVGDASAVVSWALREFHPTAALALARIENDQALAPALWWFEVRNGLIVDERRGRIREARTVEFLLELERLAVAVDAAPLEDQVSAYLELALRQDLPIATLDMPLAVAARAEGVALIGEAA